MSTTTCRERYDVVKKLKAHRNAVASLAFHPSGKFWLSVGEKDCVLKMYLCSTAKCAFDRKLDYKPMQLDFLSDNSFAILDASHIRIIDLEAGLSDPRLAVKGNTFADLHLKFQILQSPLAHRDVRMQVTRTTYRGSLS